MSHTVVKALSHLYVHNVPPGWVCAMRVQSTHHTVPVPHRCAWPHGGGQYRWRELLALGWRTGERTSEAFSLPGGLLWLWKAAQFNVFQGKPSGVPSLLHLAVLSSSNLVGEDKQTPLDQASPSSPATSLWKSVLSAVLSEMSWRTLCCETKAAWWSSRD